jgi:hypothetical protein
MKLLLRGMGVASLIAAIGFWVYVGWAIGTGSLTLGSRAMGNVVVSWASSAAPFLLGLSLYGLGALTFSWIAWQLLRPERA